MRLSTDKSIGGRRFFAAFLADILPKESLSIKENAREVVFVCVLQARTPVLP